MWGIGALREMPKGADRPTSPDFSDPLLISSDVDSPRVTHLLPTGWSLQGRFLRVDLSRREVWAAARLS